MQFAHATAIMIVTPQEAGAVFLRRRFCSQGFAARHRRGLKKIGNLVDQVLLYCYHYDPVSDRKVWRDCGAGAEAQVL